MADVATESMVTEATTTVASEGAQIVKDMEEALVHRLTELFVEYKPWIMGLGISTTVFVCFIFLALIFIMIILICQSGGSLNTTMKKLVNRSSPNYTLLRRNVDDEEEEEL